MAFKMPWSSTSGESKPSVDRSNVSLNDILPTTALRVELMLLVVLCTDEMKEQLSAIFQVKDYSASSPGASAANQLSLLDFSEIDHLPGPQQPSHNHSTGYIHNLALQSRGMQDLKTAAVSFHNSWRTSLLRRLGETLKVQPDAVKRAKAHYIYAKDQKTRNRQYQEYIDGLDGRAASKKEPSTSSHITFHTKLNDLDVKTRALILNAILFILLSLERYPSHSRVLLMEISRNLDLPKDIITSAESTLATTLLQSTKPTPPGGSQDEQKSASDAQSNRRWKVGLATIAGATLIGVTGGLAAPFLLGAAGAIMGGVGLGGLATLLGATIANPVTVAALFGVLGGRMGGKAMEEFTKEVEDFEIVSVHADNSQKISSEDQTKGLGGGMNADTKIQSPHEEIVQSQMRVALGISGHLLSRSDITHPWTVFSQDSYTSYALRYEATTLVKLGESLKDILRSSGYALAQGGALQLVLPTLSAALLPVSLLNIGSILDNPFSIAMERSDKAGIVLAKALIAKVHGERPITLVGYSLGARVIYSCLSELAKQKAFGIVESAVLIGAPVPSDQAAWVRMKAVVIGRLVNVYTTDDVLLAYLYRVRYAQIGVAGLQSISGVQGIESFDVTGLVKGHGQYRLAIGRVLKQIDFEGLDEGKVATEEQALEQEDKAEKEIHENARKEGKLHEQEDDYGRILMVDATQQEEQMQNNDKLAHPVSINKAENVGKAEPALTKHALDHDQDTHHSKNTEELPDRDENAVSGHDDGDSTDSEEENAQSIAMIDLEPMPESNAPESDDDTNLNRRRGPIQTTKSETTDL